MKLYVNRQPRSGPWGGGNLWVAAFHKRAPTLPNVELLTDEALNFSPDVCLLAGLDNDGTGISVDQAVMHQLYQAPNMKIVLRVNENDARKGTRHMDALLLKVAPHVSATVFVSHWLQDYFNAKGWACKEQAVIVNGCAADIFAPQPKLNNGKLNIVAHHWSSHEMKGADIYQKLDRLVGEQPDKFAFTYIGRHECDFRHTNVIRPTFGKDLGAELGKHDVYVSASRFDPGPNHVLESLSCGLPTYVHKDGGGCVEFAGADHSYKNWDELKAILNGPLAPNTAMTPTGWLPCVQQYVTYLEHVLQA